MPDRTKSTGYFLYYFSPKSAQKLRISDNCTPVHERYILPSFVLRYMNTLFSLPEAPTWADKSIQKTAHNIRNGSASPPAPNQLHELYYFQSGMCRLIKDAVSIRRWFMKLPCLPVWLYSASIFGISSFSWAIPSLTDYGTCHDTRHVPHLKQYQSEQFFMDCISK